MTASTKALRRTVAVPALVLLATFAGPQASATADAQQLTISSPPAWTNEPAPAIAGTSTAPEYPVEVTIYSSGLPVQTLGPIAVSSEGSWEATPAPLLPGEYTVVASQPEDATASATFVVDVQAPAVTFAAVATPSDDATPTLHGKAGEEPGDGNEVTVTLSGPKGESSVAVPVVGGEWSYTPSKLPDGTYAAEVVQEDRAGNVSRVSAPSFTIDTTAPAVSMDAVAALTSDATPQFSGGAGTAVGDAAEVTVTISSGSDVVLSQTVGVSGGRWTFSPPSPLPDGAYTVRVAQADTAGNLATSAPAAFTVDTTAPKVSIEKVQTPTNDSTPMLKGSAGALPGDEHHVTVELHREGGATTTATVSVTSGKWSYTPASLADGAYLVHVVQEDEAGNVGAAETGPFTVDTVAPAVAIDAVPHWMSTSTPTLSGGAGTEPGDGSEATVTIYRGESTGGIVSASGAVTVTGGRWSYPAPMLVDGTYTAQVAQSDAAGNIGTSKPVTFTVDTTVPVVSIEGVKTPTNDATPTLRGTAGSSSGDRHQVTLRIDREGGAPVAQTVAVSSGKWSYTPSALSDGAYTVEVEQEDEAGNVGKAVPVAFVLDTVAPAVAIDAVPRWIDASTPTLSGGAGTEPGDGSEVTVTIYRGESTGGTVYASGKAAVSGGRWSYRAPLLDEGTYTADVAQSDAAGNAATGVPVTFTVDEAAPKTFITKPGAGQVLHTATPTFSGIAGEAPGDRQTVRLRVYHAGGALAAEPSLPVEGGEWKTSSVILESGTYTAVAVQEDEAGNVGLSKAVTFSIDAQGPTLSMPGLVARGSTLVSLPSPRFSGNVAPEASPEDPVSVLVMRAGSEAVVEKLSATVAGATWSASATAPLPDGAYVALATQEDHVSHTLGSSAPVDFTVDSHAPAVTLTSPTANSDLLGSSVSLAGSAGAAPGDQPRVTVQLYPGFAASGSPAQSVTLPVVAGAWSGAFGGLAPGYYTARAEQTDDLGVQGLSAAVTFTISPATPAPPVASFQWFPASPHVGEPVSLVSTSSDPAAAITGYAWGLSPGAPLQAGSDTATTSFATAGDHVVVLRVSDAAGRTAETSQTIHVSAQPLVLMQPFPVVRIAGTAYRAGTRLSLFSVQAPLGAKVSVSCSGPGCPARVQSVLAASRRPASSGVAVIAFRRFQRLLRPGTVLQVKVFKAGEIGKYTRFAVRRGKLPTRLDTCLGPSGAKPMPCPST